MMWKIRFKGRFLRIPCVPLFRAVFLFTPTLGKEQAWGPLDRDFYCPRNPEEWVQKGDTGFTVANHLVSWTPYPGRRVRSEKGQNGAN